MPEGAVICHELDMVADLTRLPVGTLGVVGFDDTPTGRDQVAALTDKIRALHDSVQIPARTNRPASRPDVVITTEDPVSGEAAPAVIIDLRYARADSDSTRELVSSAPELRSNDPHRSVVVYVTLYADMTGLVSGRTPALDDLSVGGSLLWDADYIAGVTAPLHREPALHWMRPWTRGS